jgi:putative component of membrane protein insertase Oxa1/YidC/SpoIIIJ protein YidD
METSLPDLWVRQAAASAIAGYQKHLSPRKGFSCAHRVLHGGESCSQYVKRVILEQGLWAAIPATRSRFAECKVANQVLQARRNRCRFHATHRMEQDTEEKRRDRGSHSQNSCSEVDGLISCIDCAEPCADIDCTSFDCALGEQANCADLDCGSALDCAGLDCSSCDCGSGDCSSWG